MATKKSTQKPAETKEQKLQAAKEKPVETAVQESETAQEQNACPLIKARIDHMVDREGSSMVAIASITIGDAFAVHGIKLVHSDTNGLFVSMPQREYEKDGRTQYSSICHPITAEARTQVSDAVLSAYNALIEKAQASRQHEGAQADQEELPLPGQAM